MTTKRLVLGLSCVLGGFVLAASADDAKKNADRPPLVTTVKLSIPFATDKGKKEFVQIDAVFSCSAEKKADGGYEYVYSWEDRKAVDRPTVSFEWKSESVSHAVAGKRTPAIPKLTLGKCAQHARLKSDAAPAYAVTVIELLDREGKHVVGTAPVGVYFPTGAKP